MFNIVTALVCEAKPIRRYYDLSAEPSRQAFPIYQNENIRLIVSGVGKVNAAAAVAYLYANYGERSGAWLNIGIAGHPVLDVGSLVLINRITDKATKESWYPPVVYKHECVTGALVTADVPENDYQGGVAFDMEASGYYPTATRFVTGELVQCVKVISDNGLQKTESINASKVEQLISDNMEKIDRVVCALRDLQGTLPGQQSNDFESLIGTWRFTATQRHQLNRLLQSCRVRKIGISVETIQDADCGNASDVLTCINKKLEEKSVALSN